jgi:hypothetical protein
MTLAASRAARRRKRGGFGGSARAIADGMGIGPSDPPEMTPQPPIR